MSEKRYTGKDYSMLLHVIADEGSTSYRTMGLT